MVGNVYTCLLYTSERIAAWLPGAPFETRVIMSWDYLSLLFENGCAQEAYDMLTDPSARWGRMMAEGCRTIWEGFEDIESHSHAWNAYPLRLFQQYLLGVSCQKPGFAEAAVRPFFPAGIQELEGSVCTPLGLLSIRAIRRSGGAEFSVTVPKGIDVYKRQGYTCPVEESKTPFPSNFIHRPTHPASRKNRILPENIVS